MEHFVGDNDHGNHEFESIIMVVAMELAASTCLVFGDHLDNLSDISAYRNYNV